MANSVLHNWFEMDEYVQKRMLEISDPEERKLYKEVAEHMVVELHRQNKKSMELLEARIFEETEQVQSNFYITMGLTDRTHYDMTDPVLFPVFPQDLKELEIPCPEIPEALLAGQSYPLYHVYLQAGYPEVKGFEETGRRYHGTVKTPKGEFKATFRVKKNEEYKGKLMELYHSFMGSSIPWSTICAAYLQRRFTVYICSIEHWKPLKEITEVVVDFEEYDAAVRYHMVPLWNLELVEEKSSTYPVPCEDKINYEHKIFMHRLDPKCSYLVAGETGEVGQVYRSKTDLIIIAPVPIPHTWLLYKFNYGAKQEDYSYPLLSNIRKQSFVDNLMQMFHKQVRTKAGIAAIIGGFSYDTSLIYKGMELSDKQEPVTTYDMDDFLTAEIAVGDSREVLSLYFQAVDPGNYLTYDIMSFLVTQIQAAIPEYRCLGQLV